MLYSIQEDLSCLYFRLDFTYVSIKTGFFYATSRNDKQNRENAWSINAANPSKNGNVSEWIGYIQNEKEWRKLVERKEQRERGEFSNSNDDDDDISDEASTPDAPVQEII